MNDFDELIKKNNRLELKAEGLELEYKYVNELKDERIKKLKSTIELEREEFESVKKELLNEKERLINEKERLINEIEMLQNVEKKLNEENETLKKVIIDLKDSYENSLSWKITKPFRMVKKCIKKE